MSVHFFEMTEAAFPGRAGRPRGATRTSSAGRKSGTTHLTRVKASAALDRLDAGRARRWHRYLGSALAGTGAAMVPWLFLLARELPAQATAAHWNTVWVGLDTLEALGLVSTGLLLRRRDPRVSLPAAATATLLVADAWFDVLTSAPGGERLTAIAMAAGAELPMAALCAVLAVRLHPRYPIEVPEQARQCAQEAARAPARSAGPEPSHAPPQAAARFAASRGLSFPLKVLAVVVIPGVAAARRLAFRR